MLLNLGANLPLQISVKLELKYNRVFIRIQPKQAYDKLSDVPRRTQIKHATSCVAEGQSGVNGCSALTTGHRSAEEMTHLFYVLPAL